MDKEKIIGYVMNTPNNTNRAILESLLNESDSEDGNEINLLYNSSNDTYYLSEEDKNFLQSLPTVYNIRQYHILVNVHTPDNQKVPFGALETMMGNYGQPSKYIYTSFALSGYSPEQGEFNVDGATVTYYLIDTSQNYSVEVKTKTFS